jgi:hypothetical protein
MVQTSSAAHLFRRVTVRACMLGPMVRLLALSAPTVPFGASNPLHFSLCADLSQLAGAGSPELSGARQIRLKRTGKGPPDTNPVSASRPGFLLS